MSDKNFEITNSDEAKKVIGPIGACDRFLNLPVLENSAGGEIFAIAKKAVVTMVDRLDSEIHKYIVGVAKEQGLSTVVILDKEVIAEKLKRLEPTKIVMEESSVSSCVHYYCPVCSARIGKYPFCKYCGQAIDWSDAE